MDALGTQVLGTVVRLQVQTGHLKPRPSGTGHYDPAPLQQVDHLEISVQGCTGPGGVLDLHHADHPESRNVRLVNGLSLLPLVHYERLRATYGAHVVDGAAGENVLIETAGPWSAADLRGELLLEVDRGTVPMTDPMAAPPCVEFSRWCLRRDDLEVDDEVRAALEDLDHGARGFYLRLGGSGTLRVGARLLRA